MFEDGRQTLPTSDRIYRRGLVLGLTVAELFLLLLFLLLLALAATLLLLESEKSELQKQRDSAILDLRTAQIELAALQSIRERLKAAGMSSNQIETLIESTKRVEALSREVAELQKTIDELRPAAELGRAIEAAAERAGVDAEEVRRNPEALAEAMKDASKLGDIIAERDKLKQQLSETARTVDLLASSKGIDPSCWYRQVADDAGKPKEQVVWLFEVAVHDNYLVVRDRDVPDPFAADKRLLPVSGIPFGEQLSDRRFLELMMPIRNLAKVERKVREYSCVFYVGVWDLTSPGAKERWKRATEGTIGTAFYRETVNDRSW
jgi:hypothetical protein